ncbi:MAG: DUF2950 domain-containing protein [Terriglobales bacterium]|jgi:hypothetical protein
MKHLRFTRMRLALTRFALMKINSCNLLLATLIAITALSTGCNKSQPVASGPQTFASPETAGQAVYAAAKAGDSNVVLAIFGPEAKELILSGDPVQDKAGLDLFTGRYDEMNRWGKLANGGMVLDVGAENYPFPFPLLKNSSGRWYFDTASAKEEILARRIGGNELATVDVLNAMADAQAEYFSQTHDGSHVRQYAQKFISDDGKHNGLYWKPADEDQPDSPLGPLAAYASAEGYTGNTQAPQPFHGYFYRILTKQGERAHGGTKEYVVNGAMTGGFAILAYPAEYGNSGVMSFFINQDGVVFQKNLGANTADAAKAITAFDPGDDWKPVQ